MPSNDKVENDINVQINKEEAEDKYERAQKEESILKGLEAKVKAEISDDKTVSSSLSFSSSSSTLSSSSMSSSSSSLSEEQDWRERNTCYILIHK